MQKEHKSPLLFLTQRQSDRILKEKLPRSVGAQYATGAKWRNNSRMNEGMEPKQKQYPADAGRDWGQEEKETTEDEMAGWHHWLDGRESGWTLGVGDGHGGLACCDSWGRKESDTTERLIWSDLILDSVCCYFNTFPNPRTLSKPGNWHIGTILLTEMQNLSHFTSLYLHLF